MSEQSSYTGVQIAEYFALIMEFVDLNTIQVLAQHSKLKSYIANREDILQVPVNPTKLNSVIAALNVKFAQPIYWGAEAEVLDFIFEGNYYLINYHNLAYWIQKRGTASAEDFEQKNYSTLRKQRTNTTTKKMTAYVAGNLESYLRSVWLKMPIAQSKSSVFLTEILNKPIPLDLKEEIAERNQVKIQDIKQITEPEVVDLIVKSNKMEPTWYNTIAYYNMKESGIDVLLLDFLNAEENYSQLKQDTLPVPEEEPEKNQVVKFIIKFYSTDAIADIAYEALISSMSRSVNYGLDLSQLSREKVNMMLRADKLNVTEQNYNLLKKYHSPLHLTLIYKDPSAFMDNLDQFTHDIADVTSILKSTSFSAAQKTELLNELGEHAICAHKSILTEIGRLLAQQAKISISKEVIATILKAGLPERTLVQIYIKQHKLFGKQEFYDIISHWRDPFNKIQPTGKQPTVPEDELYWEFVKLIYEKGYTYKPKQDKRGIRIYNLKN